MTRKWTILALSLVIAACQTSGEANIPQPSQPPPFAELQSAKWVKPDYPATRILDAGRATDLLYNSGITLQWISWDWRGKAYARWQDDSIVITAEQNAEKAPAGVNDLAPGNVYMNGYIAEIGAFHFIFDGSIVIQDAPDAGRYCERTGQMEFRITQNRKYWRLQDMEGCGDGLTDYVDIYF